MSEVAKGKPATSGSFKAGYRHTEESKLKMSLAKMGQVSPRKGAKLSPQTIQKIRLAKLGKPNPRLDNRFAD